MDNFNWEYDSCEIANNRIVFSETKFILMVLYLKNDVGYTESRKHLAKILAWLKSLEKHNL